MLAEYDIFLSHAWADGALPQHIADALTAAGLRVWFDANEIDDFASITHAVTDGLAKSKALLAYYSKTYPLRRACQWELTAAFLAAQTEGDPRRRVLVINPENGADHIHPIELRDAKFRNAPNTVAEMQQLVQAIVKHVAQLSEPLADIHPLTAPNWYGMTPVGSTRFVGRLKEMWEVHSLLSASDVTQITGATVNIGQLSGLGGVGKSLLAEEYALHFGAAYPGGVFWLRAYGNDDAKLPLRPEPPSNLSTADPTESPRTSRAAAAWGEPGAQAPGRSGDETEPRSGDILGPEAREALRADQMRAMAERLGMETHGLTAEQIEGALSRKIATEGKPCLWIVDDVPNGVNGGTLRRWFAPHALARTLITTRSREYSSLAKGIDLSVLTPDEAYQLLTSRRKPTSKDEEAQARALANDLGYHALALDVTASALLSSVAAEPFNDFRTNLARPDKDALTLAETLADALPNGHEKSIAQTMLRSIRTLGAEGLDFLRLASVLAVAPIPASLVTAVFGEADKLGHGDAEERASLAFKQATSASLAEIAGEKQEARSVHTLVSRAVRFHEKTRPERTQALRAAAVEALWAVIAKAAEDPRLHKQIEFHLAHARQLIALPGKTISEANLLFLVGGYDSLRGSYASARTLFERELEIRQNEEGPEHPDTLRSMHNLADAVRAQGDLAGARKLREETLATCRRVLGPDHLGTLSSMHSLALILWAQGDMPGAKSLEEETVEACRRVLGPEHPSTLVSMTQIAAVLSQQGSLQEARKLQEDVLAVQRRALGLEHPNTLTSIGNLAQILRAQGDLEKARNLNEEVLGVSRRLLGPEHPETLISMINLAETLRAQGDLAGARQHEEQALEARRRLLGPEHPETLASMINLAETLRAQGDLAGAHNLQEEALALQRRVLGLEHPHTLTSMNNLAETLRAQGDFPGSRKQQEQVVEARRRLLGENHPDTLTARNNLAVTMYAQGDLAGSRQHQEQVLEAMRRLLGEEHPDTLKARSNLAGTLSAQGDLAGSRQHQEQVLEAMRRLLGEEHPDTLKARSNLAGTLSAQGDLAGSRQHQEQVLEAMRRLLGEEHPDTSIAAWNLFRALQDLGEREAARTVLEHDLLWLLDRDPATLGADQRQIREMVAETVKRVDNE